MKLDSGELNLGEVGGNWPSKLDFKSPGEKSETLSNGKFVEFAKIIKMLKIYHEEQNAQKFPQFFRRMRL